MRDSSVSDGADVLARGGASMPISFSARVDERHLVRERRQPVDAVDQRGDLRVGAVLGELLVAAVHVADDRVGRDDALAVEAHDEAQRAVRRRVLRPDVEDHVAGVELDVHLRVGEVAVASSGRRRPRAARPAAEGRWVWSSSTHLPRRLGVASSSPRGLRPASARRRRDPATASPRARAAGSPCAADGLRTRTGGRGDAGAGWPSKTMPNISHASRSCQSAPGYTDTHDSACGSSSSTSVFSMTRRAPRWCVDSTMREHLEAAGATRRRRRSSPSAAPARTCRPSLPRRSSGVGHPVDAGDEREVVAAELRPCRTARRAATRRAARARPRRRTRAPCSTIASPSSACEAREHRVALVERARERRRAPRGRLVASVRRRVVGGLVVSQRRSAPAASPRQRSAGSSFWMRCCNSTMPWMNASGRGGQPGTYTSTGMIWSTPLVTEYESQ